MEEKMNNNIVLEKNTFSRGAICWFIFKGESETSLQSGMRPGIIISNNLNNQNSSTLTVLPITSKSKKMLPIHTFIQLEKESIILCEQIQTISKKNFIKFIRFVTEEELRRINICLKIQLSLIN
jgi:mRNA interferase MazF